MSRYDAMVAATGYECPTCEGMCCGPAYENEAVLENLLRKFANHRDDCGCFICRTLTDEERDQLARLWAQWGGRK